MGRVGIRVLGALALLLVACGDDAPVVAIDSGTTTDVATDNGTPDVPVVDDVQDAGQDSGGQDSGTDVMVADAGDVPATDGGSDGGTDGGSDGGTGVRAHRATALVSAGDVMTSTGFRMISTLGQSSIHQGTLQSTGFRLRGGLVGASGGRGR